MKKSLYQSFFKSEDIEDIVPIDYINILYKKQDLDKLEILNIKFQEIFTNKYNKFLLYIKWHSQNTPESSDNYPEWFIDIHSYYQYIARKYQIQLNNLLYDKQVFFLFCYIGWNFKNLPKLKWNAGIYHIAERYKFV